MVKVEYSRSSVGRPRNRGNFGYPSFHEEGKETRYENPT